MSERESTSDTSGEGEGEGEGERVLVPYVSTNWQPPGHRHLYSEREIDATVDHLVHLDPSSSHSGVVSLCTQASSYGPFAPFDPDDPPGDGEVCGTCRSVLTAASVRVADDDETKAERGAESESEGEGDGDE